MVATDTWGPLTHGRFTIGPERRRPEGCALSDLSIHPEIEKWLRSNSQVEEHVSVQWTRSQIIPCEVRALRIHLDPLGFLLTIKVLEPPKTVR